MPRTKGVWKYEFFQLQLDGTVPIRLGDLPNRGLLAVYDSWPRLGGRRRFVATDKEQLAQTLEAQRSRGMLFDTERLLICTAASEQDFPDPAYEQLVEQVFSHIEVIRKRGDKVMLRRIRAATERKGKRPGPTADPQNKRCLIDLLADLASQPKTPLKALVKRPLKPASASAQLSRFCWGFYCECRMFDAEKAVQWQDPRVASHFWSEFGFRFLDETLGEHDLLAAKEAYRRGKRQEPEVPAGLTVRFGPTGQF
jgi:hypothetical protein